MEQPSTFSKSSELSYRVIGKTKQLIVEILPDKVSLITFL